MNTTERVKVRSFIAELLSNRDDTGDVANAESLFGSGRLDSLAAVELLMFLEQSFGLDFSETGFDIERIDSVDRIVTLVGDRSA